MKLLIDSIARNYPIGSILLLAKSPELELRSRGISAVIREGYPPEELLGTAFPDESSEHFYVLDGQQRLTSVARVLLNAHPKKSYYFDLWRIVQTFRADEANWVVVRARGKSDPDRKDNGRLIRSDVALDSTKIEVYVSEYLEDSEDLPELKSDRTKRLTASAQIKHVFETIRNYQIPAVILERDAQVESICRVFETINSTGTRLTTFDLAVAKFFPTPDLRDLWTSTLDRHPVLAEFEVDGERLLQTIALYRAGKESKYAEPTRSALLAIPSNLLKSAWDQCAESLATTYTWAKAQGARKATLPNHGVLVSLAAARACEAEIAKNATEPVIRRWYFCKILQQGGRQAANYKIGQDFQSLMRYVRSGELPEFVPVTLSQGALLRLVRTIDVRYRAIQTLMATTIRHDLMTGRSIEASSDIEDHHIFPRRLAKSHNLKEPSLDTIANRIPVLWESNREISDREPHDYIGELIDSAKRSGTEGDLKRRFADALLPIDIDTPNSIELLERDGYSKFLEQRADLLLNRIGQIIGDSLINSDPSADDEADED